MRRNLHNLRTRIKRLERSLNLAARVIKERTLSLAKARHENIRLHQQLKKARSLNESDSQLIDSMNRHIKTLEALVTFRDETIKKLKGEDA
jgi:uncharacterized coiled-coil protein SlyX